jgi:hypothetical protein
MNQNNYPGVGEVCRVCGKIITQEDCEEHKNNRPMKMFPIPGYIHRKCKIRTESNLINNSFNHESLNDQVNRIKNER